MVSIGEVFLFFKLILFLVLSLGFAKQSAAEQVYHAKSFSLKLTSNKKTKNKFHLNKNRNVRSKGIHKESNNPSLAFQTGIAVGLMTLAMGILWTLPEETSQWYDKPHPSPKGIYDRWKENIALGPIWDQDIRMFNAYGHIHVGSMYTVMCLEQGYSFLYCFTYTNLMSLAWEYGPEAFTEIPSIQDLLMTGPVGAMVGRQLYYWKKVIRRNNDKVFNSKILGSTIKFLIDPIGYISRGFSDIEYSEKFSSSLVIIPQYVALELVIPL